jgi:hypothetical protein
VCLTPQPGSLSSKDSAIVVVVFWIDLQDAFISEILSPPAGSPTLRSPLSVPLNVGAENLAGAVRDGIPGASTRDAWSLGAGLTGQRPVSAGARSRPSPRKSSDAHTHEPNRLPSVSVRGRKMASNHANGCEVGGPRTSWPEVVAWRTWRRNDGESACRRGSVRPEGRGDHPSKRPTWGLPPVRRRAGYPCPTFGLAPGGVYRAARVTPGAGALLPHRFTLACAGRSPPSAVCFLLHCPSGRPDWPLASTLPYGAPTFLDTIPANRPEPRSPGRLTVALQCGRSGARSRLTWWGRAVTTDPCRWVQSSSGTGSCSPMPFARSVSAQ